MDLGLHDENLFDQDERTDGTRIDKATGKPYDNSKSTDEDYFAEGSKRQIGRIVDLDAPIEREEMDAAAAWLAEHDVKQLPGQIGDGDYRSVPEKVSHVSSK